MFSSCARSDSEYRESVPRTAGQLLLNRSRTSSAYPKQSTVKLFVFAGAGTSAELDIPTMRPMADQFLRHLRDLGWAPSDYQIPQEILSRSGSDMEHLIDEIDKLSNGFRSQRDLGLPFDSTLLHVLEAMGREAEWFVQHLCEQLRSDGAEIVWAPFFRYLPAGRISIVTSNYDRAIEIGARAVGTPLDDGFESSPHDEVSRWVDFKSASKVTLIKVHGSTDWYQTADGHAVKLRHSIPVFGALRLRIDVSNAGLLSPALVLPSREKKVTTPPYPQLTAAMYQHARLADGAVFVGTSLRDPHLKALFDECSGRIPTAYVSRSVSPTGLGSAIHIRQSASLFLSSTLPRLLDRAGAFSDALTSASLHSQTADIVPLVRTAWDKAATDRARCDAIDGLVHAHYSAHTSEILRLLNDSSAAVRKFSLGLVRD